MISVTLSSRSLIHSFVSVIPLLIHSSVFSFKLLCYSSLKFLKSISLLQIYCIFLVCASILFLRFWLLLTIIPLNPLQMEVLSCSFIPLLSLFVFLWLQLPFCRLLDCSPCFCCLCPGEQAIQRLLPALWWENWCCPLVAGAGVLFLWWTGSCQGVCCEVAVSSVQL